MGVLIGVNDDKSGNNNYLVVIMCVRISHNIGLLDLTNRTRYKKGNGYIICTKIVRDYWGIHLMLHTWSIYYWHTNVNLLKGGVVNQLSSVLVQYWFPQETNISRFI